MLKKLIFLSIAFLFSCNFTIVKANPVSANHMSFSVGIGADYLLDSDISKLETSPIDKKLKNSMAVHPLFGIDYLFDEKYSVGIESGYVSAFLNSLEHKVNNITCKIRKTYWEIPILIRAKYINDHGFNPFVKVGFSITKTSEEHQEIVKIGVTERVTKKQISNKSISPKISIGCEYKIRDWMSTFLQYSYVHGRTGISSVSYVGIGIELAISA